MSLRDVTDISGRGPLASESTSENGNAGPERRGPEWHLATDHLLTNLRGRTISGAVVTTGAQAVKFILILGSTVILTRLLPPQDFGLVAIAMTVTGFLRSFKEAGLASATVQRPTITQAQVSNLFWINLALSALLGIAVLLSAPAVSWVFHERQLTGLTAALALTFPMDGAVVQHLGLLRRQMRFGDIALIEVGSLLAAVGVGVVMAARGCGPWALIGYQLSVSAVACVLTWSRSRWHPSRPVRRSGTRPLVQFAANITGGNLIFAIGRGADNVLIGRWYGPHAVGLYSRAEALLSRPLDLLLSPVSAVVVPVLSRIQADASRYRRTFLEIFEALALTSFLFSGLLVALTRPIVLVLLGPDWEGTVVIFAAFVLTAVFRPLSLSCSWLFESRGRGKDSLITGSVISVLAVGAFLTGLPYGPAGVAIAYSISGLIVQVPFVFYLAGRSGGVRTTDLWWGVLRQMPVWGIVYGTTALARSFVGDYGSLAQLVICAPLGILASLAFVLVYPPSCQTAFTVVRALREFRRNGAGPGN